MRQISLYNGFVVEHNPQVSRTATLAYALENNDHSPAHGPRGRPRGRVRRDRAGADPDTDNGDEYTAENDRDSACDDTRFS